MAKSQEGTSESTSKGCDALPILLTVPAAIATVAGFTITVLAAEYDEYADAQEVVFFVLYLLSFVGLLTMFVLHACAKLISDKLTSDKKSGFNRAGVIILGSGGLMFQSIGVYELFKNAASHDDFMECVDLLRFSKTVLAVLVTAMQVLFLIKFAVLRVDRSFAAAVFTRLVMGHMLAMNLCVWFRTIVFESLHLIEHGEHDEHHEEDHHEEDHHEEDLHGEDNHTTHSIHQDIVITTPHVDTDLNVTSPDECPRDRPITTLFSPYTFPLLIEFSVLVLGLYINVLQSSVLRKRETPEKTGHGHGHNHGHGHGHGSSQHVHHNTYEGLVLGWLSIMVALLFIMLMLYDSYTVVDTILFVYNVYSFNLALSMMYVLAAIGVIVPLLKMEKFQYKSTGQDKREYALLVVTCLCTVVYSACCAAAGVHEKALVLILDGFVAILGAILTAYIIIFMAPNRRVKSGEQRGLKPGRQGLEVLRCTSLALWLVNTFLLKSSLAMTPLNDTFGGDVWAIFANVVQPMTILFYFHCIMCLSHTIAHLHAWNDPPVGAGKENGLQKFQNGESFVARL